MPFPPYPNPPAPITWTDGPVYTGDLRDDVANAVSFLANRPSFQAECTSGQNIGGSYNANNVTLDSEIYDTWAGHWPNADAVYWYATQPAAVGWYLAEAYAPFNYASTNEETFACGILHGTPAANSPAVTTTWGELHPVGNGHFPGPTAVELVPFTSYGPIAGGGSAAGMFAAQNSGSGINLLTDQNITGAPRLSLRWVCALSGVAGLPVPANPAWPVPPAYITPGQLNANIRDTINFLVYPPAARLFYEAGAAKMPSGGFPGGNVVPLDTPTFDNYGGQVTNGWKAPVSGLYYFHGQVSYAAAGAGGYCAGLSVNGGTTQWGKAVQSGNNGQGVSVSVSRQLRVTAGQTVQLMGAQSSGSSVLLTNPGANSGPQSKLIAVWQSA